MAPKPELAAALRSQSARVIERWTKAVTQLLPDADPLTTKEVRDSIPTVLDKIAGALESAEPEAVLVLMEVGTAHGVARFHEHYDIDELIVEYRLLRRIIFDELHDNCGGAASFIDAVPVNAGIDTALHRGVTSYVRHLTTQLKSTSEAESKYLSFLSHDLRNNLNGVTLMLETLRRSLGASPEFRDAAEDLQMLQRSVFETVQGMNRLLQAERLRKEVVTRTLSAVDLHRLTAELLAPIARDAAEKGLVVENQVPESAAAHSERELLTLVLQNLIGNAIKFSAKGVVRVWAKQEPLGWRVGVSDQGPGIAPERVGALFEAFSRGETHGQPGMGLGLTIASHAARLLGSELTVESKLGEGSTFSFVAPISKPEDAQ
jgi:signal transduction histidine kinase